MITRAALASLLALSAALACDFTKQETASYDSPRSVLRVEVDVNVGAVTFRPSADANVHVDTLLTWGDTKPTYKVELVETSPSTPAVLKITGRCAEDERCTIAPSVEAPIDVEIVVVGEMTDVDIQGGRGSVDVTTQRGHINVTDLSGDLTLSTRDGDIEGRLLHSQNVVANDDGAGVVDLEFDAVPLRVESNTVSADILFTVPTAEYLVDAASETGQVSITVPQGTGTLYTLIAHSKSGDVTVRPPCEGTTCK